MNANVNNTDLVWAEEPNKLDQLIKRRVLRIGHKVNVQITLQFLFARTIIVSRCEIVTYIEHTIQS